MKLFSVVLLILACIGCSETNVKKVDTKVTIRSGVSSGVYEWDYKGHIYLVVGDGDSGISVTHAGHCPCGKR